MVIETFQDKETYQFGYQIGKAAKAGDIYALIGDLGVGKTVFTQGVAAGLDIKEPVNSPTFTIVKEYREGRLPLFHFDVYRVPDPEELFNIGVDEYFYGDGVSVVEWADLIEEILPENTRYIYIEYGPEEGERIYKCSF